MRWSRISVVAAIAPALVSAHNCNMKRHPPTNDLAAPLMAPGYVSQLAAVGLKFPRHIQFDSHNHLLVVDRGVGIYRYSVDDECLVLIDQKLIIDDQYLNHGISISHDGKTLFASTNDTAFAWNYDPETGDVSNRRPLITGMANQGGHITRTLLSPASAPGMLLVSVGSQENVDFRALDIETGISQIRGFNVSEAEENPIDFKSGGFVYGWGLRNSVGMAEDPEGQLWSVENSVDHVERNGESIHQNNPAEELNFHGLISDTSFERGNYGYPDCYAVWNPSEIPDSGGLQTGDQFAMAENETLNDSVCAEKFQPPRLSLHAHQAPLDIKFDSDGQAWIAFHGSWNRDEPIGYRVVTISFENGQPTEANTSTSAAREIMANADLSICQTSCFRPVGLAFNTAGHLFMSSDSTGEIYVITKEDGSGVGPITSTAAVSGPSAGPTSRTEDEETEPTTTPNAAAGLVAAGWLMAVAGLVPFIAYLL